MTTQTHIMLQIGDAQWMREILPHAAEMARRNGMQITLVKMIPVQHSRWLDSDFGYSNFSVEEREDIERYEARIAEYGVHIETLLFQYDTLVDASVQAAEHIDAAVVFAQLPHSIIPLWNRWQAWSLNHQLRAQGCEWVRLSFNANRPLGDTTTATALS